MAEERVFLSGRAGIGTWKITEEAKMETALSVATACGCRVIDTASVYKNEELVGKVMRQLEIPREDLFIQGKVWNKDRGYEKTLRAFDKTMTALKLSFMDCYMIHWPASPLFDPEWEKTNAETYRAIEHLVEEKAVGMIGLCNYAPEHIECLKKTIVQKPAINQIELHPGCPQQETADYCRKEGILLEAWSPLGSGALLQNQDLIGMAKRYGVSPAKLCLLWAEQRGIFPIVKSVNEERIRQNCAQTDVLISEEDLHALDTLSNEGTA